MGMSLGVVWLALEGEADLFFDPKVINSWFVLLAYIFYLFQRLVLKMPGNRLALWNIAAFLIMAVNVIVTNLMPSFHQWG